MRNLSDRHGLSFGASTNALSGKYRFIAECHRHAEIKFRNSLKRSSMCSFQFFCHTHDSLDILQLFSLETIRIGAGNRHGNCSNCTASFVWVALCVAGQKNEVETNHVLFKNTMKNGNPEHLSPLGPTIMDLQGLKSLWRRCGGTRFPQVDVHHASDPTKAVITAALGMGCRTILYATECCMRAIGVLLKSVYSLCNATQRVERARRRQGRDTRIASMRS
ncbi:unnamed protein product, partial [Trichogramma brassicae]